MMDGLFEEGAWQLSEQIIMRISGADALPFLHGQLTCAVTTLDETQARPAAYCTAQGRLIATGVIWRTQEDAVHWLISRDLAESVAMRLRQFILRARVSVELHDAQPILGICGRAFVPSTLHGLEPWHRAHIHQDDWVIAPQSTAERPAAWRITSSTVAPTTGDARVWDIARLAAGWPSIRAATTGQFLPSALNLDLNGTVDFQKGCYPGQEVIARTHYRGTVKRRLAYGTAPHQEINSVGGATPTDLHQAGVPDGQPVGRVIESIAYDNSWHIAAEITLSNWPQTRYALGDSAGPLLDLRPLTTLDV